VQANLTDGVLTLHTFNEPCIQSVTCKQPSSIVCTRVGVVVVLVGLGGRSKENHHRREARINKCRDEE
jgi:hypothetical protein